MIIKSYKLQVTSYKQILIFVSCFLFLVSSIAFAQEPPKPTEYELLAPLPGIETSPGSGKATTATFIPGLFRLIIGIAGVLAVVMIIFGGIKYMSTDAFGGKSEAKGIIENALWGLILALSAWLILVTINPNLVNFNLNIPVQKIATTIIPGDINLPDGGAGLSQQEAESQLEAVGIDVTTSVLQGIRQETVDEVIALKNACNCSIVVTSATGGTHNPGERSHANGWKVDLRLTESLNNYITRNYTRIPDRSDGAQIYRAPNGNLYAREGDHWDVQVR